MKVVLTGISGFIGSRVMHAILQRTDWNIIGIASWRWKGLPTRVADDPLYQEEPHRVKIITHDLSAPLTPDIISACRGADYILNLAAGSHVDDSITNPVPFIENNVGVALHMLEAARKIDPVTFIQFSTDEVYGQCPEGMKHEEWSPIIPSNPYSASKAAQEAIAISYWRTYNVPVVLTNTMNVFGPGQGWEKFIPLVIQKVLEGETVKIHGYPGGEKAGSRFYIHTTNVADALLHILDNVPVPMYPAVDRPQRLNIVGEVEVDNLMLAKKIAATLGRPLKYELVDFHSTRPGHDCRYALDGAKLQQLGWTPKVSFDRSLEETVQHYKELLVNDYAGLV